MLEQSESAGWVESDGEWKLTDPLRRGREAWVRGERVSIWLWRRILIVENGKLCCKGGIRFTPVALSDRISG